MSQKIGGLSDIKTSQKTKISSKPRGRGQEYLDLYLMVKERERLNNYNAAIGKSMKQIQVNLEEVDRNIEDLEKSILIKNDQPVSRRMAKKPISKKPLKTTIFDY